MKLKLKVFFTNTFCFQVLILDTRNLCNVENTKYRNTRNAKYKEEGKRNTKYINDKKEERGAMKLKLKFAVPVRQYVA
jgi:hypothetical protein